MYTHIRPGSQLVSVHVVGEVESGGFWMYHRYRSGDEEGGVCEEDSFDGRGLGRRGKS